MILFLKSILIGICAILPGVSGSVIAVSLGVYDKFIECISDLNKLKKNKNFIFIVIIGVAIGVYSTSYIIFYILEYEYIVYYVLIGIVLSEVPFLYRKIHDKTGKGIMIFPFLTSFSLSLVLDLINGSNNISNYSAIKYFIGGLLFSFGKVFPGISSSFFLLNLGIYDDIIILVTKPFMIFNYFYLYFPFIIGTVIGLALFIKVLKYMLNNRFRLMYSIIIGFIFSSVVVLFPGFSYSLTNIIGIILMIITFVLSLIYKAKNKNG